MRNHLRLLALIAAGRRLLTAIIDELALYTLDNYVKIK